MKAKDLLEFRAFKMALGHLINALPGSHLNHGRHGGKQRTKGLEGDGAKVDIAKLVAEVGILHEGVVALDVIWREARHLGPHLLALSVIIEMRSVIESDAVKR